MSIASRSKPLNTVSWVLRVVLAVGMIAMGALPKLTGDPLSVELFELLGQSWARIPVGLMELVGGVLILIPRTVLAGALWIEMTMLGAIASHLGPLGWMPELSPEPGAPKEALPMVYFAIAFVLAASGVFLLNRGGAEAPDATSPAPA